MKTRTPETSGAAAYRRQEAIDRLLSKGTPEGRIADLLSEATRAEALLSDRESPRYDRALLRGVHEANLRENWTLPGVEAVYDAGLDPLFARECEFPRLRIQNRKLRAVIFVHEGIWYYLATGSAANAKDGSTNEYAEVLCDLLEILSPRLLAAVSIARLLRSTRVASVIQAAIEDHVDVVKLGTVTLNLRDEMSAIIWTTYAAMATVERNLIVQRLSLGRINKWSRGEWFFGRHVVPPGYRLNERLELTVDETQRELVDGAATILANPTLPHGAAAVELGRIGCKTRDTAEPGRDVSEAKDAWGVVTNLRRWVDLWMTGRHVVKMVAPFPNIETFGGRPVHYSNGEAYGYVELPYEPGRPEGGWSNPEVLAMAAELRDSNPPSGRYTKPRGRAASQVRRLLTGLKVTDADGTTTLQMRHTHHGVIEVVPYDTNVDADTEGEVRADG